MRHITIYECFDTLQITKNPTENTITVEEADELNRYIIKESLKQSNISWGRNSITFINYVGFIKLSTVSIEILPKINISSKEHHKSRKALINILNKSGIIKFNYSNVGMLNMYNMSLNEILTLIFAKTLQRELVKGPYLEYVNIEENSKALKGSIVVKEHIKNISSCRSDVYCRYEEFSMNNKLNQILYDEFDKMDVFTTCIVGIIDSKSNTLDISNAGHYCPIIIDNSGKFKCTDGTLCKKNIPLGVLEDINYEQSTISIKDSSMICMYTDGIIEIKNKDKEEFGIERFESFLLKNYMLEKDDFINALKKELGEFVPKHNFDDDILVVCLSNK